MNIAQWLYASALTHPHAPALFLGTQHWANYQTFAKQASQLGHWLQQQHKIQQGDRVAIYAPNCVEYLSILYGCWWIGAVTVPVNPMLHPQEAAWIADNAQATLIFTDSGTRFTADQLPASCQELAIRDTITTLAANGDTLTPPQQLEPDALAWLFYTSGTTGRPKGVMLSHANLMAMALCYGTDVDKVESHHATVYAAPMSHGAGLYNFMYVRAAARHIIPESSRFNSGEILDLAKHHRHVSLFAAPTMCKRLVNTAQEAGVTGEGFHTIVLGGGPMYSADLREAMETLGPCFAQIYGQGESPMTITAISATTLNEREHPNWQARLESVGTAQSCMQIRVVDQNLNDLPAGSHGEVLAKGPAVMLGYWRNPEATADTLVNGWLRTGDIGFINEEGYLTLTDRAKDVVISGGSNVYPREVEEVLISHPEIFEAAVVGAPSEEWGEEVVAFIVCQSNTTLNPQTLDAWCLSQMASYKKPKRYFFVDELKKNSYGKILKTELRKQLRERSEL